MAAEREADPAAEREVVLYTSGPDCSLCERAQVDLGLLAREFPFRLSIRDVRADRSLYARFGERVPIVLIDGRLVAEGRIGSGDLRRALGRSGVGGGGG